MWSNEYLQERDGRRHDLPITAVHLTEEWLDEWQVPRMLLDQVDEDRRVERDASGTQRFDQSHDLRSVSTWAAAFVPAHTSFPMPRNSRMEKVSGSANASTRIWVTSCVMERR